MIKLFAFDIDGTLAPSRGRISEEMGKVLAIISQNYKIAIVTGGALSQIEEQILRHLPEDFNLMNLELIPTSGAGYYSYKEGGFIEIYNEVISIEDRVLIMETLEITSKILGYWELEAYGNIIEDRGSQITYSGLGQSAPIEKKIEWDKDGEKRGEIIRICSPALPLYKFKIGGSSSIDVTVSGIDKGFGMQRLMELLELQSSEIVYFGDRFDESGNDYPVIATGVNIEKVTSPDETIEILYKEYLKINL